MDREKTEAILLEKRLFHYGLARLYLWTYAHTFNLTVFHKFGSEQGLICLYH